MKFAGALLALASLFVLGPLAAKADTIDNYSFSVTITGSNPYVSDPFAGNTYTGTFQVDNQTGDVTNFSADLLGGSFTASDLGDVATFTHGVVSSLVFGLNIAAPDGHHSSGFTTGFNSTQIYFLGVDPNNYFAFLNTNGYYQGGGTPSFTDLGPAATPEPASWTFVALGLVGLTLVGAKFRLNSSQLA